MGDSEWQEVTRKKSSSGFHRLKFPSNKVSMVDDLAKISLTVYVSHFFTILQIEGVPLRGWETDMFNSIARKWGELLFMDDFDGCNRVRELCSWTPSFTNDDSESDAEDSKENLDFDNEKNSVDSDAEFVADLFADLETGENMVSNHHQNVDDQETKMLQVDLLMLRQSRILCNENYVVIDALWTPDDIQIRWIAVYAPQNLSCKIALWSMLANLIADWDDGFKFTWMDKWGSKMSKLDRPILLRENVGGYGYPFRFFHSWLEIEGFHNLVSSTWKNDGILEVNGLISFKKKLQNLKCVIREWIALKKADTYKLKKVYQKQAKRRFLTIRGILKDGEWIDDPVLVKSEFFSHFSKRFQQPLCTSNSFDLNFANPLSHIESAHLERSCSRDEIKWAVWDCGGDRAPGPDGFSFKFFTTFWDHVEDYVVRFVNEFFSSGRFPKGCQSYRLRELGFLGFGQGTRLVLVKVAIMESWMLSNAPSSILVNGLNALSCKGWFWRFFKGASFGRDNVIVSHLMYADDVIFLGECKVLGVGISDIEVSNMAKIIGCGVANFPLKYLGVPVGCKCGILFKWIWRFLSNPSDLWARAISSIYGFSGGVDLLYFCSRSIGNGESTKFWDDIWHSDKLLKGQFQRIYMLDTNRESTVANRASISNCHAVLRRCPRGGAELSQLEALQDILKDVVLSDQHDTWIWSLDGADCFSVASVRP
ncbi:hypothetical protein Tco_0609201 [Tanacetum coccineum]